MGTRKVQMSFASGEVSPSMYGRFDDQKYQAALARCRNFVTLPQGPAEFRPGTAFVNATKYPDKPCRLIPFKFSADNTVVLEFGHKYVRFHTDGQTILGSNGKPYEIETPYESGDVMDIHYCQSMDVMTLVHPAYPPKELRRYGVTDWRLVGISFGAPLIAPGTPSVTYKVVAAKDVEITNEEKTRYTLKYKVTALKDNAQGTQESAASSSGQTQGNLYLNNATCTISWGAVSGANRYRVYKNYRGMYCYIGETAETSFIDDNYEPDASITPPIYEDPFGQDKGITSVTVTNGGSGYQALTMEAAQRIYNAFVDSEGVFEEWTDGEFMAKKLMATFTKVKGSNYITYTADFDFDGSYQHKGPVPTWEQNGNTVLRYRYNVSCSGDITDWANENFYEVVDVEGTGASVLLFFEHTQSVQSISASKLKATATIRLNKVEVVSKGSGNVDPVFRINDTRFKAATRASFKMVSRYYYDANERTSWHVVKRDWTLHLNKFFPSEIKLPVEPPPNAYVIDPSESGVGAELGLTVKGGKVVEISVRYSGSGYVNPQVVILGGGGKGATARANVGRTGDYPSAVCYFEQRRCFAGSPTRPQTVWMTRTNTESDMSYTLPSQDDNRLRFAIAAQEASRIRHLLPLLQILALTDTTEYRIHSGGSAPLSPTALKSEVQAQIGASNVMPLVVNSTIVYAASRGGHLREMGYNWQASGFTTGDLSVRAAHFFENNRAVDMTLVKSPYPIIWAAMSNGSLLGFTYMPEQGIGGWHMHTTVNGAVESVTSVPEGDEDILYLVVRRTINGQTVRYVERMKEFFFTKLDDAWHVDCGGEYRGSATTTVSGLTWLEGETVSILADGCSLPKQKVTGGKVTLPHAAAHVIVGLPITGELETLPVAVQMQDGSYGTGHAKNINDVFLRVHKSSGIAIGPSFDKLVDFRQREDEPYGSPPEMVTREIAITPIAEWNDSGQICLRQSEPLPLTVVSVAWDLAQ